MKIILSSKNKGHYLLFGTTQSLVIKAIKLREYNRIEE